MKKYYTLLFLSAILLTSVLSYGQVKDDQIRIPDRENAKEQQQKPYVILISIDGFRDDYFEKFKPEFLNKMRRKGTSAEAMLPSFPSVTFPNHYTLVTGLIPPHHGLIGNSMYDPETDTHYSMRNAKAVKNADWYGGTPIWSLAESQQMLSACYYWPGSEAPIAGYYPTYYYPYSETTGIVHRVQEVVNWLQLPENKRPHLITFYMPQVDHAGHTFGPDALETQNTVQLVDTTIKLLTKEVAKTKVPVNYIFVSDHGMTTLDQQNPLPLPEKSDLIREMVNNGTYVSVFVKNKENTAAVYNQIKEKAPAAYDVYLKEEVPEKYEFSASEDTHNRAGDIILIAHAPFYFSATGTIPVGSHGFLTEETPDMKTVFMAWGPNIKNRKKIKVFKNIHIYPLLAELLELNYDKDAIDGDNRLVPLVLKKK